MKQEQKEIKFFGDPDTGRLNADDAPFSLGTNEWVNLENCRVGSTDKGVINTVESIGSTRLLSTPQPSVTFEYNGGATDTPNRRIVYCLKDIHGTSDKIVCYDYANDVFYDVLLSSQVVDGLNFNTNYFIHSCRIVGSLFIYTDNFNEPKCVNIDRGIKLNQPSYVTDAEPYATPIPYETVTLIQRPPIYPLEIEKLSNGAFDNNYIKDSAYQFDYFYIYKDYQQSALSPFSSLAPYNAAEEDSNYIAVSVPFVEQIPDYAQQVCLCVRYGNDGKTFIMKRFNKSWSEDLAAIEAHNAGTTQLSFDFYDNEFGEVLDSVTANTPFDNVALEAKTLEVAENRLFLGNVLKGYDTPVVTSLTAELIDVDSGGGSGSFDGIWGYVTLYANWGSVGGCQNTYMYPFVYVASGGDHVYYYFPGARVNTAWNGGTYTPDLTTPQNVADATIQSDTEANFIAGLKFSVYPYSPTCTVGSPTWETPYLITLFSPDIDVTINSFNPTQLNRFFKSSSDYTINIEFKDRFNRKCGVNHNGVSITIPDRTYDQTTFTTAIQWALSNDNALEEIPDWAYYYQILIKKNQTTRFFVQLRMTGVQYVTKNQDGTYTYGNTYTFGTTYALGIDISALTNYGLGYVYNVGDYSHLILSDNTFLTIPVIGQDGNFVWLAPHDVGSGSTSTIVLLELYTPYKATTTEFYYETPIVYPVLNPATDNRAYSTLSDTIQGDTYALVRTDSASADYAVEAMSPDDNVWQIWQTDTGWPNLVDTIGQVRKLTNIDWSDTFITGTKVNGLPKFQPLNTTDVGNTNGELNKLQLTSKSQNEKGVIMLGVCQSQTVSMYLGEVQQYGSNQQTTLTIADNVIGTINVLKGSFGTVNPESVTEYRGNAFWFDALNGRYVQYSQNGLYPISNYKMTRFWKQWAQQYMSMTAEEIQALGDSQYVFSVVDSQHNELQVSLPKLSDTPPKGYLPDYPSTIYPFDILDFQDKTIVYRLGSLQSESESNKYIGAFTCRPEGYLTAEDNLFIFRNGFLYLGNQTDSSNEFFGQQNKSRIMFVSNANPTIPKIYNNNAVQGNMSPTFVYFYNDYPVQQSSDLVDFSFKFLEGTYYATILRNKLVPTAIGFNTDGLLVGEKMRNLAMYIMLEFTTETQFLELKFYKIGYEISSGSTV